MLHHAETSITDLREDLASAEVCNPADGLRCQVFEWDEIGPYCALARHSSGDAVQRLATVQSRAGVSRIWVHFQYTGIRPGYRSQLCRA
jgi:hypothetical protein